MEEGSAYEQNHEIQFIELPNSILLKTLRSRLDDLLFPHKKEKRRHMACYLQGANQRPIGYIEYTEKGDQISIDFFASANGSRFAQASFGIPGDFFPKDPVVERPGTIVLISFVDSKRTHVKKITLTSSYTAIGFYKKLAQELIQNGIIENVEQSRVPNQSLLKKFIGGKRFFSFNL